MSNQDAAELDQLAGMDKVDAEDYTRTLTGFDELAIKKAFGVTLEDLEGSMIPRSLLFIRLRRDGAKDPDAYRTAMQVTYGRLEQLFVNPNDKAEVSPGKAEPGGTPSSSPTS